MSGINKKAKGTGTVRHKTVVKNGKEYQYWEGRVTTGTDPLSGKQIQKSVTGKTQAEVIKKMREIQIDVDNNTYLEPSKIRVSEWLDIWIKEYSSNVKPGTLYIRDSAIQIHIKPMIGKIKLSDLNTIQIQKMYNSLSSVDGSDLSPRYKRNILSTLHNALQTAVKIGIIKTNPADNIVKEKNTSKQMRVLTDEETSRFLMKIRGNKYEDAYIFTIFTGLRRGEVCGLSWNDIDFKNGTITICHQLQRDKFKSGKYVLTSTKNGKSRIIKPAPYVMDLLHRRKVTQYKAMLEAKDKWSNPFNLVFTIDHGTHPGRYIVSTSLYNQIKKIFAEIGIPEMRLHDLRHTYAVISIRNGDDIKMIQENLGHSSAAFTLSTYIHVTSDMKDKSSERMEEYIEKMQLG